MTCLLNRIMPALRICLLTAIMGSTVLKAQNDRHYNTNHHGLRGMILNGAMVAGVDDNSAIYYNPAALSISEKGLDLSLFALSLKMYKEKNLFNTQSNSRVSTFDLIPGLITFNLRPFKNKGITLSAGSFTINNFRNQVAEQFIENVPEGIRVNGIEYEHNLREYWLAVAVAYKFNNNVAIGMSQYFTIRKEHYSHDLSYQLFDALEVGKLIFEENEKLLFRQFNAMGLINKLGLAWNHKRVSLGATLTTPIYGRIIKSADLWYDKSTLDDNGTTAENFSFENNGKEKSPLIVKFGAEYKGKTFLVAVGVDYFTKIGEFDLIRSSEEDFQPQINGADGFALEDSRKRIINFNLGVEVDINEMFGYLGGFRTNFNYNERPADFTEARLHWSYFDIYHLTNGLKVNVKSNKFTIGIDYAFSIDHGLPPLADLDATSILPFSGNNSSVLYNNLTFLFTYKFLLEGIGKIKDN